jgi:uncharacterized membrane protein
MEAPMTTETRLTEVEVQLEEMSARMRRLELDTGVEGPTPSRAARPAPLFEPAPEYTQPSWAGEERTADERPAADLEQVFGGRVLAWVGGFAILIGAALFLGMSISHGWLDETARTAIGLIGSVALLLAGVWLHERKGRAEAAEAAAASGISGLFATLVVATQVYELISPGLGLLLAALVATAGFLLAVRWSSPVVAALGSLGALAAPVLVGVDPSGRSIAFVALALAATVGVLIWQRWDWLALGAFVVSAPQLIVWCLPETFGSHPEVEGFHSLTLPVLLLFWGLYVAAAFGFELRERWQARVPAASWLLLLGSSALVVGLGYAVLLDRGHDSGAVVWLFAFAAIHLALGALARRLEVHREISALLTGTGIALSAFGLAEALSGPALVAAWAAAGVALAWLARGADSTPGPEFSDRERLLGAGAVFLALAVGHTLAFEAPPSALFHGVEDLSEAIAAIGACAVAAIACVLATSRVDRFAATIAGTVAAVSLVYLGSIAIVAAAGVDSGGEVQQAGQTWLSAFWTATGLGALVWGLVRDQAAVRRGGLALLGVAIAKVWTYDLAELDELSRVLSFVGLGLLLLVGAFAYQRITPATRREERRPADPNG